jgi:hypothetical protein
VIPSYVIFVQAAEKFARKLDRYPGESAFPCNTRIGSNIPDAAKIHCDFNPPFIANVGENPLELLGPQPSFRNADHIRFTPRQLVAREIYRASTLNTAITSESTRASIGSSILDIKGTRVRLSALRIWVDCLDHTTARQPDILARHGEAVAGIRAELPFRGRETITSPAEPATGKPSNLAAGRSSGSFSWQMVEDSRACESPCICYT